MQKLPVEFSIEGVELTAKSEAEGRPIFEDREFIRIFIPGPRGSEVYREATAKDREDYAEEYKLFKGGAGADAQTVGTPLKAWPAMTPATIREFNAMNIRTVEHLANLSDTAAQGFMGAREWIAKAKAFLETAKDASVAQKYAAEAERLRDEVSSLKAEIAKISARVEARGPGRPPKVLEAAE